MKYHVKYKKSCDAYQTLSQDGQQTPAPARHRERGAIGPKKDNKEGQYDPDTEYDPKTGALDPASGHIISNAYDKIWNALRSVQP
jgi:hypothetical protein